MAWNWLHNSPFHLRFAWKSSPYQEHGFSQVNGRHRMCNCVIASFFMAARLCAHFTSKSVSFSRCPGSVYHGITCPEWHRIIKNYERGEQKIHLSKKSITFKVFHKILQFFWLKNYYKRKGNHYLEMKNFV